MAVTIDNTIYAVTIANHTIFPVISIEWQLVALKHRYAKYSSATSIVDDLRNRPSLVSRALSPK